MIKVAIDKDWANQKVYFFVKFIINNIDRSASEELSRLLSINMIQFNKRTITLAKQIGANVFPIERDLSEAEYENYLTFVLNKENAYKIEQFEKAFKEEFCKELILANM